MKIYCLYGVGLPTERSYFYVRTRNTDTVTCDDSGCSDSNKSNGDEQTKHAGNKEPEIPMDMAADLAISMQEMIRLPNLVTSD